MFVTTAGQTVAAARGVRGQPHPQFAQSQRQRE